MIGYLSVIVGLVFLSSGLLKAVHVRPFIVHLRRYRLLPDRLVSLIALFAIEVECGVGVGLIIAAYPTEMNRAAGVILVGLFLITAWGVATKRIEHCGCYGGIIWIPPKISLLLNGIYILLLLPALLGPEATDQTPLWKVFPILSAIGLSGFLSRQSTQKPLIDRTPLRPGKKWMSSWLIDNSKTTGSNKILLFFFRERCHECQKWFPILNRVHVELEDLSIAGILPEGESDVDRLKQDKEIEFAVFKMKSARYSFLIYQVPTLILVENGVIQRKWTGEFPDEILNRI